MFCFSMFVDIDFDLMGWEYKPIYADNWCDKEIDDPENNWINFNDLIVLNADIIIDENKKMKKFLLFPKYETKISYLCKGDNYWNKFFLRKIIPDNGRIYISFDLRGEEKIIFNDKINFIELKFFENFGFKSKISDFNSYNYFKYASNDILCNKNPEDFGQLKVGNNIYTSIDEGIIIKYIIYHILYNKMEKLKNKIFITSLGWSPTPVFISQLRMIYSFAKQYKFRFLILSRDKELLNSFDISNIEVIEGVDQCSLGRLLPSIRNKEPHIFISYSAFWNPYLKGLPQMLRVLSEHNIKMQIKIKIPSKCTRESANELPRKIFNVFDKYKNKLNIDLINPALSREEFLKCLEKAEIFLYWGYHDAAPRTVIEAAERNCKILYYDRNSSPICEYKLFDNIKGFFYFNEENFKEQIEAAQKMPMSECETYKYFEKENYMITNRKIKDYLGQEVDPFYCDINLKKG